MPTYTEDHDVEALALAGVGPRPRGRVRDSDEDFRVDEVLGFEPDGVGDHQLLQIEKRGLNSVDVARHLARHAGVPSREVGFCGLKDRRAVAVQWFSVGPAGGAAPDWSALTGDRLRVLRVARHRRKLRRGSHTGNRFTIRVRGLAVGPSDLQLRLAAVRERGVPNYFGAQRFGWHNLETAQRLFDNRLPRSRRQQRSMALSAARSHLFNLVLARRVADASWDRLLPGDVANLDGSRSFFALSSVTDELRARLERRDLHPTGPLFGRGANPARGRPLSLEQEIAERFADWCAGLVRYGLRFERRALRVCPAELEWCLAGADLTLSFMLPRGAFATSVLREIVDCSEN